MSFAPTDLAGLQLWLKADSGVYSDAGVTPATNGGTVQQWNDLSGNSNHYSQSTSGNRPSYVTATLNGLPVVRSSGTKWLTSTNNFNVLPVTVWVVTVVRGYKGARCGLWSQDQAGLFGNGMGFDSKNSLEIEYKSNFAEIPFIPVLNAGYVFEYDWTGTAPGAAAYSCWQNGCQLWPFNASYTSGTLGTSTGSALFGTTAGSSFSSQVDIAEVIIQTGGTTSGDRANVLAYLNARWGLGDPATSWPATPYYMWTGFQSASVGETLLCYGSTDGVNWTMNPVDRYGPPSGSVRDPSWLYYAGKYWVAYTTGGLGAETSFGIASSTDRIHWTFVTAVDCSSVLSASSVWAPEWFVDPADGLPRITVSLMSSGASHFTFEVHPTNAAMTTWSLPVQVTGAGIVACIDTFVMKIGATYYLWYKNESSSLLEVARSTSLLSGYTALHTGNWAGWGTGQLEGPTLVLNPTGGWRLYVDNTGANNGKSGICYSDQTAGDWTTGGSTTWSALLPVVMPPFSVAGNTGSQTQHGSVSLIPAGNPFAFFRDPLMTGGTNTGMAGI